MGHMAAQVDGAIHKVAARFHMNDASSCFSACFNDPVKHRFVIADAIIHGAIFRELKQVLRNLRLLNLANNLLCLVPGPCRKLLIRNSTSP